MSEITLKNVSKKYENGNFAVREFNLDIHDKEFIIFVGPSGCGKSTTLRMIAGLEDITDGELWIDGQLCNYIEPQQRGMSMVFQNYALYPNMTVYGNIAFALKIREVPKAEIGRQVHEVAKILEIEHLLDRRPSALSGGQKQRVAIGSAIIRQPKAFLMDEPLSNLDAKLRTQMRVELAKLHKKLNTTIIYVTHDQTEAMTLASKIVVMKGGVVQQAAAPAAIYNHPANKFVAGFIGSPSMNFFEAKVSALGEKKNKAVLSFGENQEKMVIIDGPRGEVLARSRNGQHVIMGIRPEDITDYENAVKGGFERSSIGITERITAREMLGSEVFLYFDECDTNYSVRLKPNNTTQPNEKMTFYFNPNKVHIFDCNTEENLF